MYSRYHDAPPRHSDINGLQHMSTHVVGRPAPCTVTTLPYRTSYRNRVNENICRPCTRFGWPNPQLGEVVREGVTVAKNPKRIKSPTTTTTILEPVLESRSCPSYRCGRRVSVAIFYQKFHSASGYRHRAFYRSVWHVKPVRLVLCLKPIFVLFVLILLLSTRAYKVRFFSTTITVVKKR